MVRRHAQGQGRFRVPIIAHSDTDTFAVLFVFPHFLSGTIENFPFPSLRTPVRAAVNDDAWLDGEFLSTVQDRGAAIIKARQKSSAASAASSCVDHVRNWVLGTQKGEFVSMGVYSDGKTYGVPEGLIFSFPCQCYNGEVRTPHAHTTRQRHLPDALESNVMRK